MEDIYFITGITGNLGRTIAIELLSNNKKVVGFVLPDDKNLHLESFPKKENLKIIYGNVLSATDLDSFLGGYKDKNKILIHCAGLISITNKYEEIVYKINVDGTKMVTDKAIEHKVKKYIYISSVHALEEKKNGEVICETNDFDPEKVEGTYAKTKAMATKYILEMCKDKINVSIVMPSGIIGPNDYLKGHINSLFLEFLKGDLTAIVKGGYNMVDVRDISHAVINATTKGRDQNTYILSGEYYSIKELLDIASKITGHKKIKVVLPIWFVLLFVPLITLYFKVRHERPLFTAYSLRTLLSNSNFTNSKARRELAFSNTDIEKTIKDTIDWFKDHKLLD